MIDGVVVRELKTHADDRGFFREIVRFEDVGFSPKQISHARRITGIGNGWHIHRNHAELFYITQGVLRVCLKDCRVGLSIEVDYPYNGTAQQPINFGESNTPYEYMEVVLSEMMPKIVLVPAGVAHAYKVLSGECDIVYAASLDYSKTRTDEGRIEFDRWNEHEWWRGVEIR